MNRKRVAESVGVAGLAMIVAGCYLIYPPLACLATGATLLFVGVRIHMRGTQ